MKKVSITGSAGLNGSEGVKFFFANPYTDFSVNANGTLNLLEMTKQYCPEVVFIFTSTKFPICVGKCSL